MNRLTENEVSQVLSKIRKKYDDYAKEFGRDLFSYDLFKERYLYFLKTRSPIEVFIFAEIQALEDKKKEIEDKILKKKRLREAEAFIEKKQAEILEKIKNYPEDNFHPNARFEIKKLVATLKIIYEKLTYYLFDIPLKYKASYQKALNRLKDFMVSPYSGNFAIYNQELRSFLKNNSKLEILEQGLIQEWGIAINTFIFSLKKINQTDELDEFIKILEKIALDFRLTIFKPITDHDI